MFLKLLMITGLGSAKDLASGKQGAFYNTLEEFSKYWERIDIIAPKEQITNHPPLPRLWQAGKLQITNNIENQNPKFKILFGNVYVHASPWPLTFHPFWFLKKAFEIYKEQKFDLITVHEFPPFYNGIAARLLWNKIKVPYILEIHHVPGYPKAASLKEKIYRNLMGWFIKFDSAKAKAIRVVNQKQTPEFLIDAGVSKEKIIYIPSMYIDLDVFRPMAQQFNGASSYKKYDLIFVGRLEVNKGINLLFEAIKNLKSQIPNIKCLIVGSGSFANHWKLQITNWKLQDNILQYGYAKNSEEIAKLINQTKIFIMPSYNEGGPRVVLEAMACGIPVLATNVGLMPDFANENAVKIIDWNVEDIAKKAKELLENNGERERLSKAGLEIARRFEKKEMIENYADFLKKIT